MTNKPINCTIPSEIDRDTSVEEQGTCAAVPEGYVAILIRPEPKEEMSEAALGKKWGVGLPRTYLPKV